MNNPGYRIPLSTILNNHGRTDSLTTPEDENIPIEGPNIFTVKRLVMIVVLLFLSLGKAQAHHGGLALDAEEGKEVDEEATQWQQEDLSNNCRVKFLSYPKLPLTGEKVRLVFELQSAETGLYLSDLPAHMEIKSSKGTSLDLTVPPVEGVPGYYEVSHQFSAAGNYGLVFQAELDGKVVVGNFSEVVELNRPLKNGYIFLGRLVVLLASGMTLMGASLSLRHRYWNHHV